MKLTIGISICVIVVIAGGLSCAGSPGQAPYRSANTAKGERAEPIPDEILEVLEVFEHAVQTGDPELLQSVLGDEPLVRFTERTGHRTDIRGFEAIAEFLLEFFREFGFREDFQIGDPEGFWVEGLGEDGAVIGLWFEDFGGEEWIHIHRQADGFFYIHQIGVSLYSPGEWVTNRYQALTDRNSDGFLDGEERWELMEMTFSFFEAGPHPASTPADDFYDLNDDGFIDGDEIGRAADIHFILGPQFWREIFPWESVFPPDFDLNGDGEVDDEELVAIRNRVAGLNDLPIDLGVVLDTVPTAHFPDLVYLPVPRGISNTLDTLGDGNGDGMIDEQEQEFMLSSLVPAHKEARNYFERAIDRNRDGMVDDTDVFLILQQSAVGRGIASEDAQPPYQARTIIDRIMDANNDRKVTGEEIDAAVGILSGDARSLSSVTTELRELVDGNGDRLLEAWEIEEAKSVLIYPRPGDPDSNLDRQIDENNDGFLDPWELGISAGETDKGQIPSFDERILLVSRRSPSQEAKSESRPSVSDFYRKLGSIQDKKLAVVSLNIGTERVDEETASGIIVFVENAFVNVGKVKVVDRANIEEIFNEVQFQMSGVIDESTAVEIGKLSGADIIVIGSINRVGDLFYLNIKLIDVATAEIIGSSIAQSQEAAGFLEMANQAVYKLF